MFCHLFSILRLRGGGGSTGTTAQGLHMSKSGPEDDNCIPEKVEGEGHEVAQYVSRPKPY